MLQALLPHPRNFRFVSYLIMASLASASLPDVVAEQGLAVPPWRPDLGDGTYRNPVINADYSDPDVVRVGDDYWMTSSSFGHVPGLPILHSRDLVNWRLVNHALPRLVPESHFEKPRHGEGVWAPSFRYHDGKYWIFYPDPDFGIYVITTDNPAGSWSRPHLLKAGKGLIDPCPLWDEDGRAYFIHGWAKSRAGINNLLTLHEITPDGRRVLDEGRVVIDANKMEGWRTLEGPKLYKRDGWYYVFAPAGGVKEGYQAVFRSRSIWGPYEARIVLEQGSTPVNGPHQGAWVETPAGEHWFFHFQEIEASGRVVHLQPMEWREDGWPVMGRDEDGDGTGEPYLVHAKPALPEQHPAEPPTSDSFAEGFPGLQWQWQGNPAPDWIGRREAGATGLRLRAVPTGDGRSFWSTPNLLMQKFPGPKFRAETVLHDFSPVGEGERAGLVVFGYDYAWLGLRAAQGGARQLVFASCRRADKEGQEQARVLLAAVAGPLELRVEVDEVDRCRFSYRLGGAADWVLVPGELRALSSRWVGAKVGLFADAPLGAEQTGHADFGEFRVE